MFSGSEIAGLALVCTVTVSAIASFTGTLGTFTVGSAFFILLLVAGVAVEALTAPSVPVLSTAGDVLARFVAVVVAPLTVDIDDGFLTLSSPTVSTLVFLVVVLGFLVATGFTSSAPTALV